MKLHEILKDAGDIIQMLETRERSSQEILEIAAMIQSITTSDIAAGNQKKFHATMVDEMIKNMRKHLPNAGKGHGPINIPNLKDLMKNDPKSN